MQHGPAYRAVIGGQRTATGLPEVLECPGFVGNTKQDAAAILVEGGRDGKKGLPAEGNHHRGVQLQSVYLTGR